MSSAYIAILQIYFYLIALTLILTAIVQSYVFNIICNILYYLQYKH